ELCAALALLLPQNCDPRACWAVPRSTADYEKGPAPFAPIPSGWRRALCFVVTRSLSFPLFVGLDRLFGVHHRLAGLLEHLLHSRINEIAFQIGRASCRERV